MPGLVTCFSSSRLISPATHFVLVVFCGGCRCACQVLFSLKKGGGRQPTYYKKLALACVPVPFPKNFPYTFSQSVIQL